MFHFQHCSYRFIFILFVNPEQSSTLQELRMSRTTIKKLKAFKGDKREFSESSSCLIFEMEEFIEKMPKVVRELCLSIFAIFSVVINETF